VQAARAAFAEFGAVASVALMTLDDEMALAGCDERTALARTLALPAPELVIKRGDQPTVVRLAGQPLVQVAVEPVPRVVDTTAAGDSFAGAYLAARLGGATPEAAARAGNRLAARVVQHRGAVIPAEAMADLVASSAGNSSSNQPPASSQ
jgi:2-dehydro-3-deoxygluconokinase